MSNNIEIENTIIVVSTEIIQKLFEIEDGCDAVALYMFYHKQCKLQKTNQTWTVGSFIKKGLGWGDVRLQKAKRILKSFNLIEDIKVHGEGGKIDGWFVKINYMKTTPHGKPGSGLTTPPGSPPGGLGETNAGSSISLNAGSSPPQKKEDFSSQFEEYFKINNNITTEIAKCFLRMGWKPNEKPEGFREWIIKTSETYNLKDYYRELLLKFETWYEGQGKKPKNYKSSFLTFLKDYKYVNK